MKICMIGAGYVGLVTGAGLAEIGNEVVCADVDEGKIRRLREGEIPIFEPGLEDLVERNMAAGRLSFTTDVGTAVGTSQLAFIAVGTPQRTDGGADLSYVLAAADEVVASAHQEMVLVLKSTVPVGTNDRVRRLVAGARHPIHVVSNPEFLREGEAVQDFLRPDRIVVGVAEGDEHARRVMHRLYKPLNLDMNRLLWMAPESAELSKYVANTMLAMRISFMNEVAALCEKVGADVHEVRLGVGSDARIGHKFLYAGPGYGGSCFPKDVQALIETGREHGLELELAGGTRNVNDRQKGTLLRKLKRHFDGELRGSRIAVWGIAFKPKTDDIRESPALTLIESLLSEGAQVVAHDPAAARAAAARFEGRVEIAEDHYAAAEGADALVLVTEWRQYQSPDFERLKRIMKRPVLFDGRNVWSSYDLPGQGFRYEGIGVRTP